MPVLNNPASHLLSGITPAPFTGNTVEMRHAANYGYLYMVVTDDSARIILQTSHDGSTWLAHSIYTAVVAAVTAQITDYLPYVRAVQTTGWGDSTALVYYQPGLQ